jgi:hypothetical protein
VYFLVWVLSALSARSRRSFVFVQPTLFGFTSDAPSADAEADLLVTLDGRAVLCEVKSSWRSVRLSDLTSFAALARRLRPDVALLAVMEEGPIPIDLSEISQLAADGIEFELLTLDHFKFADDPYLSFDD